MENSRKYGKDVRKGRSRSFSINFAREEFMAFLADLGKGTMSSRASLSISLLFDLGVKTELRSKPVKSIWGPKKIPPPRSEEF